jgi:hypothetical protein
MELDMGNNNLTPLDLESMAEEIETPENKDLPTKEKEGD